MAAGNAQGGIDLNALVNTQHLIPPVPGIYMIQLKSRHGTFPDAKITLHSQGYPHDIGMIAADIVAPQTQTYRDVHMLINSRLTLLKPWTPLHQYGIYPLPLGPYDVYA